MLYIETAKGLLLKFSLLLTSLLFLLMTQSTLAQTPVAIEGLQVIAERQYAADVSGTIDTNTEDVFLATVRVYLFDNAENAESTWQTLVAAESIEADLPDDDDSVSYEKLEVEDVGDRAVVLSLSAELDDEQTGVFRTMMSQKDAMIVTVTVIAGSVEAATIADDIVAAMIDREPGDDDAVYDGNGASSGGVWEVFLPGDADELGALRSYADKETRPA